MQIPGLNRPSISWLFIIGLIALIAVPQFVQGVRDRPANTRKRPAQLLLENVVRVLSLYDVKSAGFQPLALGPAGGSVNAVRLHQQPQQQQQHLLGTISCKQMDFPRGYAIEGMKSGYVCDLQAYEDKFDPDRKYNLMLSREDDGRDLVQVDDFEFNPSQVGKCKRQNADHGKEEQDCVQTVVVKPDNLVKIGPITRAQAKSQFRVLMEKQNAKNKQSRGRKTAEIDLVAQTMQPYSVSDHTLWNDDNGKYSLLTTVRHIIVRNVTAAGGALANLQYKFCSLAFPYNAPHAIVPIGCVEGVAPGPGTSQVHEASTDVIAAPAPATANPPKPFNDMTVCSQTPDATQSLCTTVSFLPDGNAKACAKAYLDDNKSAGDQSIACVELKACAVSGDGCPLP